MVPGARDIVRKALEEGVTSGNGLLRESTEKDLRTWRDNLIQSQVEARLLGKTPSRVADALILIIEEEVEQRAEENLEARFHHHDRKL